MSETVQIPVWSGQSVRAWATVDADQAEALSAHRWRLSPQGYAARAAGHRGGTVLMHREVLGFATGDPRQTDHINRDRLDNRRANLRQITLTGNAQNTGARPNATSRYRGVSWVAAMRKWKASVQLAKRNHHLGYFDDEDQAARVAAAFRAEHMPYAVEGR